MSNTYIPQTDTGLAAWSCNFSALISATPGAYGLMASDASTIAAAFSLFNNALNVVLNSATRTKAAVADKNAKKAAMLVTLRQYAQVIKRNLGISNQAKLTLGLHINDSGRTPVPAPTTTPVLSVAGGEPLSQIVNFNDSTTPESRAKPAGVTGMMLAMVVGTTPPADPNTVPIYGIATRRPYVVKFNAADKGKTAYYYGRWITASGLVGLWSMMAQMTIAG